MEHLIVGNFPTSDCCECVAQRQWHFCNRSSNRSSTIPDFWFKNSLEFANFYKIRLAVLGHCRPIPQIVVCPRKKRCVSPPAPLLLLVRAGFRGEAGDPGPQASHQQGVSHQTPQFLKPCNLIANPFLKSQIRHWAQVSHQLNPALLLLVVYCQCQSCWFTASDSVSFSLTLCAL